MLLLGPVLLLIAGCATNTNSSVIEPRPTEAIRTTTYTVQAGETLALIAAAHGTSVERLVELNQIPNPNIIEPGQILTIERTHLDSGRLVVRPRPDPVAEWFTARQQQAAEGWQASLDRIDQTGIPAATLVPATVSVMLGGAAVLLLAARVRTVLQRRRSPDEVSVAALASVTSDPAALAVAPAGSAPIIAAATPPERAQPLPTPGSARVPVLTVVPQSDVTVLSALPAAPFVTPAHLAGGSSPELLELSAEQAEAEVDVMIEEPDPAAASPSTRLAVVSAADASSAPEQHRAAGVGGFFGRHGTHADKDNARRRADAREQHWRHGTEMLRVGLIAEAERHFRDGLSQARREGWDDEQGLYAQALAEIQARRPVQHDGGRSQNRSEITDAPHDEVATTVDAER